MTRKTRDPQGAVISCEEDLWGKNFFATAPWLDITTFWCGKRLGLSISTSSLSTIDARRSLS